MLKRSLLPTGLVRHHLPYGRRQVLT
jgi:hypothetical protein